MARRQRSKQGSSSQAGVKGPNSALTEFLRNEGILTRLDNVNNANKRQLMKVMKMITILMNQSNLHQLWK